MRGWSLLAPPFVFLGVLHGFRFYFAFALANVTGAWSSIVACSCAPRVRLLVDTRWRYHFEQALAKMTLT